MGLQSATVQLGILPGKPPRFIPSASSSCFFTPRRRELLGDPPITEPLCLMANHVRERCPREGLLDEIKYAADTSIVWGIVTSWLAVWGGAWPL